MKPIHRFLPFVTLLAFAPVSLTQSAATASPPSSAIRTPVSPTEDSQALTTPTVGSATPLAFGCSPSVEDAASGNCMGASSIPTLGMLYPLGNEFYIDALTQNVGLGTTTPAEKLQIGEYFLTAEDNYIELRTIGGGFDLRQGMKMRSSNPFFGFDIEHDDGLKGLNFLRWDADFGAFGDSALYLDRQSGNVGLGTTEPATTLDVRHNGFGHTARFLNENDAGTSSVEFSNTAGEFQAAFGYANPSYSAPWAGHSYLIANGGTDFVMATSNTERARITSGGNVGIGTTAPGQLLDVAGTVRCINLIQTSDERLKEDVRELDDALGLVRSLRGVSFEWDREQLPKAGEGRQVGFLAQEVQQVLPEVVHESEDGYLAVAYAEVVPVLVEALRELEEKVTKLEAELAAK